MEQINPTYGTPALPMVTPRPPGYHRDERRKEQEAERQPESHPEETGSESDPNSAEHTPEDETRGTHIDIQV
jgi:hypothetical protein